MTWLFKVVVDAGDSSTEAGSRTGHFMLRLTQQTIDYHVWTETNFKSVFVVTPVIFSPEYEK